MASQSCWKCGKEGNLGLKMNGVEMMNLHTLDHIKELIGLYEDSNRRGDENDYLIICPVSEHPRQIPVWPL